MEYNRILDVNVRQSLTGPDGSKDQSNSGVSLPGATPILGGRHEQLSEGPRSAGRLRERRSLSSHPVDRKIDDISLCPKVLFIGGTGRCGTSITRSALGRHPKVAALPFEYRFLVDPDGFVDFLRCYSTGWSPYIADRRIKRLEHLLRRLSGQTALSRFAGTILRSFGLPQRSVLTPQQYDQWSLNDSLPQFSSQIDQLLERLVSFSYSASWIGSASFQYRPRMHHARPADQDHVLSVLREFSWPVIQGLLKQRSRDVYVEDNTWNSLCASELLMLFPTGKYLHVYRDPRDVVVSLLTQRWCPSNLLQACQYYTDLMRQWFEVRKTLDSADFFEITMEDLVRRPSQVLSQVCNFADLPFHEDILGEQLSASSIGRWRRDLTSDQQSEVNDRLAYFVEELGYNRGNS